MSGRVDGGTLELPLFVRISLNLLFFLKKVCARRGCPDAARHLDCAQSILVQPGGIWDTAAGKPAAASARAGNFRSISLGRTGMMDSSSGRRALGAEAILDPARREETDQISNPPGEMGKQPAPKSQSQHLPAHLYLP